MAKECLICKTINHSAANHCTTCGNELPDKELLIEEQLRIELHEAKESKKVVEKALADAQNGVLHELEKKNTEIQRLNKSLQEANSIIEKMENAADINSSARNFEKTKNNASLVFFLVLLIITCCGLGIQLSSINDDLNSALDSHSLLESRLSNSKSDNEQLTNHISNLQRNIDSLSSIFPFRIDLIEIGNTDHNGNILTGYGNSLYANRMRYLSPKIYYTGFANGTSITINYKIFNPNGALNYNSSYSTTYTGSGTPVIIYQGSNNANLQNWGNASSSAYSRGTYRIEIWHNGMCYGTKNFIMY